MVKIKDKDIPEICRLHAEGYTYREIGKKFGCSYEWIRKKIVKAGAPHGAERWAILKAEKEVQKKKKRNEEYVLSRGCSYDKYREIQEKYKDKVKTPYAYFFQQRTNARTRRVEWNLNFYQWWIIWSASGKWKSRGRKLGEYVMCRKGDKGAYEKGNVFIDLASSNCVDGKAIVDEKRRLPTKALKIVRAAGGVTRVGREIGLKPASLSGVCNRGYFPTCWLGDGRLAKIAALAGGIYSVEEMATLK